MQVRDIFPAIAAAWRRRAAPPVIIRMGNPVRGAVASLTGLGAGALGMYLLDPQSGARRRSVLRGKSIGLVHDLREETRRGLRDLGYRAHGAAHAAETWWSGETVPDDVLVERVRARVGHLISHPVEVQAQEGRVVLSGDVLADEVGVLVDAARHVGGVRDVEERLQIHEQAAGVPGLQGVEPLARARRRGRLLDRSPGARLILGTVGGTLLAYGIGRRRIAGGLLALSGAGMLARVLGGRRFGEVIGVRGRMPFEYRKSLWIAAPVSEVFGDFSDIRKHPRFMSHVLDVRPLADNRSHWVLRGPAGFTATWDAETAELEPNRSIAWRSVSGSRIRMEKRVRFQETEPGLTRMDIYLRYWPAAGALGHLLAKLFGTDPKKALDDDLLRFKSLLEEGKARAHGETVERRELWPDESPA